VKTCQEAGGLEAENDAWGDPVNLFPDRVGGLVRAGRGGRYGVGQGAQVLGFGQLEGVPEGKEDGFIGRSRAAQEAIVK